MIFITLKYRNFVSIWVSPLGFKCSLNGGSEALPTWCPTNGSGGSVVLNKSRKYPYPHQGWPLEIPKEQAILILKFLRKKYKTKLEIPGGRGLKNQITILLWRFEYFLFRITHLYLNYMQGKGQVCIMSQGAH